MGYLYTNMDAHRKNVNNAICDIPLADSDGMG